MDDIKREELEKMCKKICKVRARMVAVRVVHMLDMSVEGAASIKMRCPTLVRSRLCCYDKGLQYLLRCRRLGRISPNVMDNIIANMTSYRIILVDLQQYIRAQTGASLYTTYVRKIIHRATFPHGNVKDTHQQSLINELKKMIDARCKVKLRNLPKISNQNTITIRNIRKYVD